MQSSPCRARCRCRLQSKLQLQPKSRPNKRTSQVSVGMAFDSRWPLSRRRGMQPIQMPQASQRTRLAVLPSSAQPCRRCDLRPHLRHVLDRCRKACPATRTPIRKRRRQNFHPWRRQSRIHSCLLATFCHLAAAGQDVLSSAEPSSSLVSLLPRPKKASSSCLDKLEFVIVLGFLLCIGRSTQFRLLYARWAVLHGF